MTVTLTQAKQRTGHDDDDNGDIHQADGSSRIYSRRNEARSNSPQSRSNRRSVGRLATLPLGLIEGETPPDGHQQFYASQK